MHFTVLIISYFDRISAFDTQQRRKILLAKTIILERLLQGNVIFGTVATSHSYQLISVALHVRQAQCERYFSVQERQM